MCRTVINVGSVTSRVATRGIPSPQASCGDAFGELESLRIEWILKSMIERRDRWVFATVRYRSPCILHTTAFGNSPCAQRVYLDPHSSQGMGVGLLACKCSAASSSNWEVSINTVKRILFALNKPPRVAENARTTRRLFDGLKGSRFESGRGLLKPVMALSESFGSDRALIPKISA